MKGFSFTGLLQEEGWMMPAYVLLDDLGRITSITNEPQLEHQYEEVRGYTIPGFTNAHSHAFQYAMAGLTERHTNDYKSDNFWSWRNAMYRVALTISPEQMEAIAAKLYSEMLRHGYAHVVEFHYIHNDPKGHPYTHLAELGERLIAAAQTSGIKITLVPILYQEGGFDQPANNLQRRFITQKLEDYYNLYQASEKACEEYKFANIGIGPHSLRAVKPQMIKSLSEICSRDIPFHMHLSEQLKEIQESIHHLGKRPVEWMLENIDVQDNYNFVHCTHLNGSEITNLAKSKANVILCPSTEGNLGDGIFSLTTYQEFNGRWSIGTDSQIGLNPFEDLRILDYGQRSTTNLRTTFHSQKQKDSGSFALQKVIQNGRESAGNSNKGYFETGEYFDALIIDSQIPILQTTSPHNLTSTIVYSSDASMHRGTIINGEWIINNNLHKKEEVINQAFIKALKELKTR